MEWMTLASTAIGALLALGATVIANFVGSRDSRRRDQEAEERKTYLDYALAAEAAHDALRRVADPGRPHENLAVEARRAVSESGIYGAREQLLVTSSANITSAGEEVLRRLADMRRAIRDGATLSSPEYHAAYHPYAKALWRLRTTARHELGRGELTPSDVGKPSWDSQENCDVCLQRAQIAPAKPAPTVPAQLTPLQRVEDGVAAE